MSDSDSPSSPKKEEMDVSENGDAIKMKEDSDQDDSTAKESPKKETPKKEPAKKETPKKDTPKKETPEKEEADEESEEEDDEEPPLGLLERPVELTSGKREKKKVERLEVTMNLPSAERKKVDIPEGKGTKLGECPGIEFRLNHTKANDLKPLHRFLFSKAGSALLVKKNIRQFSGFTFVKGDKEFEKRVTSLNKMTLAQIKQMCKVLGVEQGGTKSAIIDRMMEFLLKPSDSGPRVPEKKKRKSKGGGDSEKKGAKRKRTPKKKETKSKPSKDLASDISDSDNENEEEEVESKEEVKSASEEDGEEEEEEEPPKKKAKVEKKSPVKKEAPKAKKQNGKQEKAAKEKKEPKKKKKVEISDDSDSDDEPLAPKTKEPPNNSELKDVIKKILDGANLEEVTMKTVVKQVYEKYPSFDLTDRKDFIKTTVREIIS